MNELQYLLMGIGCFSLLAVCFLAGVCAGTENVKSKVMNRIRYRKGCDFNYDDLIVLFSFSDEEHDEIIHIMRMNGK